MTTQLVAEQTVSDELSQSGTKSDRERRGRRWIVWSFILCPCHLPITLGVIGTVFGGSALGALVARNGLAVGLAISALYAVGLGIGLRHIQQANKEYDCSTGECKIPEATSEA